MRPKTLLSTVRLALRSFSSYFGKNPRDCPLCGYKGRFLAHGDPPRWDAKCSACGSLERHRLLKLFLDRNPGLVRGSVIHFAPEASVTRLLKEYPCDYRSADLSPGRADLQLNLEAMELPDSSVDLFVCSHVLEHVDDAKALSEMRRCLKPGGSAILMVPIVEGWRDSYEDESISSEAGRLLHFGQADHVRRYGADFRDRLHAAGFDLGECTPTGEECVRYSIIPGERVFLAAPSPSR